MMLLFQSPGCLTLLPLGLLLITLDQVCDPGVRERRRLGRGDPGGERRQGDGGLGRLGRDPQRQGHRHQGAQAVHVHRKDARHLPRGRRVRQEPATDDALRCEL